MHNIWRDLSIDFYSPVFIFLFFPLIVFIHSKLQGKLRLGFLILVSQIYYLSHGFFLILPFVLAKTLDYIGGICIDKAKRPKLIFFTFLILNLSSLIYWKYLPLEFAWAAKNSDEFFHFLIPLGVSFYSIQGIAYLVEVYQKKLKAETDPLRYFSAMSFFPILILGPVESPSVFFPKFFKNSKAQPNQVLSGALIFLWGVVKKIVCANRMIAFCSQQEVLSRPFGTSSALLLVLFMGIAYFVDFSAYSDMALGISRALGIEVTTNFRAPFSALSVRELWKRWHHSLHLFMVNYAVKPLSGLKLKHGFLSSFIVMLLVFTLSAFWHGPFLGYFIFFYGNMLAMLVEKKWRTSNPDLFRRVLLRSWVAGQFSFFVIFFHFPAVKDFSKFFGNWNSGFSWADVAKQIQITHLQTTDFVLIWISAIAALLIDHWRFKKDQNFFMQKGAAVGAMTALLFVWYFFGYSGSQGFLYFGI